EGRSTTICWPLTPATSSIASSRGNNPSPISKKSMAWPPLAIWPTSRCASAEKSGGMLSGRRSLATRRPRPCSHVRIESHGIRCWRASICETAQLSQDPGRKWLHSPYGGQSPLYRGARTDGTPHVDGVGAVFLLRQPPYPVGLRFSRILLFARSGRHPDRAGFARRRLP